MLPLTERRRKDIATLARRRGRDTLGQFVVEGRRSVAAAIDAGAPLVDLVLAETALHDADVRSLADRAGVPAWRAPDRVVERLSDVTTSQGVLAVSALRRVPEGALEAADRILLLDGIQDPGNVGTILRSAAWFGVGHVVIGPGTADPYAPKVVRATMGALWDVTVVESPDLAALAARLRAAGRDVWAADLDGIPLGGWAPPHRSAVVLGSEAHGPAPAVRAACSGAVTIPASGAVRGTESLNVAAAAAVLLARWTGTV